MDKHDDIVSSLTVRLELLSTATAVPSTDAVCRPLSQRLLHTQTGLGRIHGLVEDTSTDCSVFLDAVPRRISDFKRDLTTLYDELVSNDIDESDELSVKHPELEVELSEMVSMMRGSLITTLSYKHYY